MKNTGLILWGSIMSIFLLMTSCERTEGEGGKATIEGVIYKIVDEGGIAVRDTLIPDEVGILRKKRLYSSVTDTIVAAKEDVFIIYGDDEYFGDDIETDFNGKYQFKYLVDGNYTIFAYNNLKDKVLTPEFQSVKIGKTGTHKVPDIYIRDGKNAGLFAIVGQVQTRYNGHNPKGRMDISVFLKRKGTLGPLEDVETDNEGYFMFPELTKGEYEIWVETEEYSGYKDQISPLLEEVKIDGSQRIVELPEPMVMYLYDNKEE